jgi:purine-binding chemotaxis protein CheW
METKQYLTFRWHELQYGIETALVQEIFPLPELIPINDASLDIMGLLNLRGQMVPIIHLDLLQERPLPSLHLSDSVVIVQWESMAFGLVVHEVSDVIEMPSEVIETNPPDAFIGDIAPELITGVAKVETGDFLLLKPNTLIRQPDAVLTLIWDAQLQIEAMGTSPTHEVKNLAASSPELEADFEFKEPSSNFTSEVKFKSDEELQPSEDVANFYNLYCPNATLKDRATLRQRADNLKQAVEGIKATSELMSLAVIGLNNEYFGLDLDLVREFIDVSNLTRIPCCPNHIVGNMNLRGEIVTLVDIRNVLNLPSTSVSVGTPAVVVQVDDIVAGLPVDEVLEMVYLNSDDVKPLPSILSAFGEQYVRGTAFFEEKMLRLLDLPKIFTQGGLAVNEEA